MIIGLTGLIGSGKSTIGDYLRLSFKIPTIDCDDLSHRLYEQIDVVKKIEFYSGRCRNSDNSFSRKKLLKVMYRFPDVVKKVESIVHPLIKQELESMIVDCKSKNQHLIILAPLLFEAKLDKLCDKTIYIYTDDSIRVQRLFHYRKFKNIKHIRFFDNFQIPASKKFSLCDHVILNNDEFKGDVYELLKELVIKIF